MHKASGTNVEAVVFSTSSALVRRTSLKSKLLITLIPLHLFSSETNAFVVFFLRFLLEVYRRGLEPRLLYDREINVPVGTECKPILEPGCLALLAGIKTDLKEKLQQHRHKLTHFVLVFYSAELSNSLFSWDLSF